VFSPARFPRVGGLRTPVAVNVKVKTNAVMIREREAQALRRAGVEQVQISVYSHRAEVHDGITRLPGSLARSISRDSIPQSAGPESGDRNVLMKDNFADYKGSRSWHMSLAVHYTLDPTVTPKMDGDRSVLDRRVAGESLPPVFRDESLVGDVAAYCAPPPVPGEDMMDGYPCRPSTPRATSRLTLRFFPCVQFPIVCGNLREQAFEEIWRNAPQFHEVRSIRARDLTTAPAAATWAHVRDALG